MQTKTNSLTREPVLEAALKLARVKGYSNIRQHEVAVAAGVATGSVSNAFGTLHNLKRAVMRAAVQRGDAVVVAQGLAARDPHALKAPPELKQAAAQSLLR